MVWIVDLICYPLGKAIDRMSLSNLTEDDD
jgi:hypothetical protein